MPVSEDLFKAMVKDPADHFDSPEKVLFNTDLDTEQKRRVLESWKVDEQELAKATEENMGASNSNSLAEVTSALSSLNSQ